MVSELTPGPVIGTYLVTKLQVAQTKLGKNYWRLTLGDKTGTVDCVMWDIPRDTSVKVDDFVKVEASVEMYKDALQMNIRTIAVVPDADVNIDDFLPRSAVEPQVMLATLMTELNEITNDHLRELCIAVVKATEPQLLRSPAATYYHHAFVGGLLEHILSLMGAVNGICQHYRLDRDLLITTCLTHDIGKCLELSAWKSLQYTTLGKLVGHVVLGIQLVDTLMGKRKVPNDLRLKVMHMIASHHGTLEHGAAAKPATREAMVFNYLDLIDSRMGGIERAFRDAPLTDELVKVPIMGGEVMR